MCFAAQKETLDIGIVEQICQHPFNAARRQGDVKIETANCRIQRKAKGAIRRSPIGIDVDMNGVDGPADQLAVIIIAWIARPAAESCVEIV